MLLFRNGQLRRIQKLQAKLFLVGKTKQCKLLHEKLRNNGIYCQAMEEGKG